MNTQIWQWNLNSFAKVSSKDNLFVEQPNTKNDKGESIKRYNEKKKKNFFVSNDTKNEIDRLQNRKKMLECLSFFITRCHN